MTKAELEKIDVSEDYLLCLICHETILWRSDRGFRIGKCDCDDQYWTCDAWPVTES